MYEICVGMAETGWEGLLRYFLMTVVSVFGIFMLAILIGEIILNHITLGFKGIFLILLIWAGSLVFCYLQELESYIFYIMQALLMLGVFFIGKMKSVLH